MDFNIIFLEMEMEMMIVNKNEFKNKLIRFRHLNSTLFNNVQFVYNSFKKANKLNTSSVVICSTRNV